MCLTCRGASWPTALLNKLNGPSAGWIVGLAVRRKEPALDSERDSDERENICLCNQTQLVTTHNLVSRAKRHERQETCLGGQWGPGQQQETEKVGFLVFFRPDCHSS